MSARRSAFVRPSQRRNGEKARRNAPSSSLFLFLVACLWLARSPSLVLATTTTTTTISLVYDASHLDPFIHYAHCLGLATIDSAVTGQWPRPQDARGVVDACGQPRRLTPERETPVRKLHKSPRSYALAGFLAYSVPCFYQRATLLGRVTYYIDVRATSKLNPTTCPRWIFPPHKRLRAKYHRWRAGACQYVWFYILSKERTRFQLRASDSSRVKMHEEKMKRSSDWLHLRTIES